MLPTKLLLSLQSAEELRSIEGLSFPWLDLKNPAAGSLGCPDLVVVEEFLRDVERFVDRDQCQLSVAMGELIEQSWSKIVQLIPRFDFAKVALAGCADRSDWKERANHLAVELPANNRLILVHYADYRRAASPDWEATLEAAASLGSRFLLIDTFDKSAGRLWDWYSTEMIRVLAFEAKAKGVQLSIAGSLHLDELDRARKLGASVIGIRGAACQDGSRTRGLCRDRLSQLSEFFAYQAATV